MEEASIRKRFWTNVHQRLDAPFYSHLSCIYDHLAWIVSGGLWKRWTFAAEGFIAGQPVLDVGCGRGHLLARLAAQGLEVLGVDASRQMAEAAQRRLSQAKLPGRVVCADGRQMPFASGSVGTIINTFPTRYVLEQTTWLEYLRLLRPGGRWIIVEKPLLVGFSPRLMGLYLITLSKYGSLAPMRSVGAGEIQVPSEFFPRQRKELVPVGPTRVVVNILEKA